MSITVMKKLTALVSLRDVDRLVRRLMRLRCVEIASVPLGELPDGGTLLRYDSDSARAEAERRVADVTAALALLDGYAVHDKPRRSPIAVTAEEFRGSGRFDAARSAVGDITPLARGGAPASEIAFLTESMTQEHLNNKLAGMEALSSIRVLG